MRTRTKILGGIAAFLIVGGIAGAITEDEATVNGNDVFRSALNSVESTTTPAPVTVDIPADVDESTVETTTTAVPQPVDNTTSVGTVSQQQALASAEQYLEYVGGFSRSELVDQLEYEQFATADAEWAVDNVSVDWTEQAEKAAADYMEHVGGFSYYELVDQLLYEGFTQEQAEAGARSTGLTP